jgi:hypothetical protein
VTARIATLDSSAKHGRDHHGWSRRASRSLDPKPKQPRNTVLTPGSNIVSFSLRIASTLGVALESAVAREHLTVDEAISRVLEGLLGLTIVDVQALAEPPREYVNRRLKLHLTKRGLCILEEYSLRSTLGISSICRKLLRGILISREIQLIHDPNTHSHFLNAAINYANSKSQERDSKSTRRQADTTRR